MLADRMTTIKRALYPIVSSTRDVAAAMRLRHLARQTSDSMRPIRVAILLQCPELWDKLEDVYECMWNSVDFEPVLVALPDPSVMGWDEMPVSEMSRSSERLCVERYCDRDVIFAVEDDGSTCDLCRMGFDYVFFQRPYDTKLPKPYRSSQVSRWSRVCYMPYGLTLATVFENMHARNSEFMRSASFVFLSSKYLLPRFESVWSKRPGSRNRHFESHGYPALARYARHYKSPARIRKVLWTPRWSTDSKIGGSHFLDYKDLVPNLVTYGFELTMRPHQLLWDNLVETKIMTRYEVDLYRSSALQAGCRISEGVDCAVDFEWSDVVIADYSSITVEYFLSGKPMVYCPPAFEPNGLMRRIMEGMYVAECWEDIERHLDTLAKGEDPKRSLRKEIAREEFGDCGESAERIVGRILEDWQSRIPGDRQ